MSASANSRAFQNPYPDHSGEVLLAEDGKMDPGFCKHVKGCINTLLTHLESGLRNVRADDFSVYTGQTGISLMYLHLYDTMPDAPDRQAYLEKAVAYLQPALRHLGSDVYTFLCGDAGCLAVGAVAYSKVGDSSMSKKCVDRLEQMSDVVTKNSHIPDEHLYGRAGYLAAVMFVQSRLGDVISAEAVLKVVRAILASGQALSKKKGWKPPLMYTWYREHYLGAAHGLAGIFYTLLLIKDPQVRPQIKELVLPCLDYMLTLQFPSGNYPAVIGDGDDRLVHWCHGAPGWTSMWTAAYETYKEARFLEAAERCGEVTWHRGLLKKGYGLCHGAAGNAYAFLALFRLTHNQKHLYRACKLDMAAMWMPLVGWNKPVVLGQWCFDYGRHGCRIPDTPFSLFEGMAGTIYFLSDMLDPLKARFPAYEY